MISALEHPLVADYLRELDAALAGLPAAVAAELSEQLRAHLLEALRPDADDQAVTAVLAALGPASLVAAAVAGPAMDAGHGKAWRDPPWRRLVTWARRQPVTTWLAVAAIAIAAGVPSGTLIFWQAQPELQWVGAFEWWSPVDAAHAVETQAAGATQDTVPLRPGKIQGFAILVYNPSDLSQVITGSADYLSPGAPVAPQIGVSATGNVRSGYPRALRYRTGGPIPPHSYRWVRMLWRSDRCYLEGAGSSQGTGDLPLRVRVGWITRTEDIPLLTEYAVAATAATTRADAAFCRSRQATP